MATKSREVVKLFWTGGWDSTFRLIQLLVKYKEEVQPFYLLDPDRRSTGAEINAMRNIKRRLFDRFPDTRNLLHSTRYGNISDICPNLTITDSLQRIGRKYGHIGSQYDWLSRYCYENSLDRVEIGVTRNGPLRKILSSKIQVSNRGSDILYWVDPQSQGTDEYTVFGYFHFPLFDFTKKDMQEVVLKEGLDDLMSLTWFCHKPLPNFTPCGVCVPCSFTIEEGMGWRMPWSSRIRYLTSLEVFIRKNAKLHHDLRIVKRWLSRAINRQTSY